MRVVMVIAQYPPVLGGTERACQRLSGALVRQGHAVTVITRRAPGTPLVEDGTDGVRVLRVPAAGGRALAGAAFVTGALARLQSVAHDVVHCHQALSPATVGALARRARGRPVVVKLAGPGAIGDIGTVRRGVLAPLRRCLLGAVDGWICPSAELVSEIGAYLPGARAWQVPNGVDAAALAPVDAARRDALRRELGLSGRAVLFTGALRPEKNLPLLVAAIAKLPEDVNLVIAGEGAMRPAVEAAIRAHGVTARVRLLGAVADVAPWLAACDAFVMPSASEGMSNALLEAMAAALPIVATDVPGNAALLTRDEHALLPPPGSEAALVEALGKILGDQQLSRRLGAAARARVVADYALDSVARRVAQIYAQL